MRRESKSTRIIHDWCIQEHQHGRPCGETRPVLCESQEKTIFFVEPTEASTRAPVWGNTARVVLIRSSTRAPVCRNTARVMRAG